MPEPKDHFTVGIVDDVTFTSLPEVEEIPLGDKSTFEAKFYGLGADGTVGANKNSVKIIGDNTNKYCQAYFSYDSKKSGGFTCSHLRFGDSPIRSTYQVNTPNFVACHVQAYLNMYDVTRGLRKNGTFLLNTIFEGDELVHFIPNKVKRYFAKNNITVYYINATKIAQEIGLGNRTNTILQSAFFRITEVIPLDLAVDQMKKFIVKSYSKKGQDVVDKNFAAVDRGNEYKQLTVDPAWANLPDDEAKVDDAPAFVKELVRPMNAQAGDLLKVSDFVNHGTVDGTWSVGTAAFDKRGVATSFQSGMQRTVSSVTSVHTFVLMLVSVHSYWMRLRRLTSTKRHSTSSLQSSSRECSSVLRCQFSTVQVVATVLMYVQVRRVTRLSL